MKAISLWQPWASAIALGHKSIETRHWQTSYRGTIAIHAAKRWTPDQRAFAEVEQYAGRLPAELPFGAVVCVAELVAIERTEDVRGSLSMIERAYGNYDTGRFAWILKCVHRLDEPYFCKGEQGIFNVELPTPPDTSREVE